MGEAEVGEISVQNGDAIGTTRDVQRPDDAEPRWPVLLTFLALGGLYAVLPPTLLVGNSRWLLLSIISLLLVPTVVLHLKGHHALNQLFGYVLNGVVTAAMIWSLALLIRSLLAHTLLPQLLLLAASALWVSNILVFASWYWRLDAGGPHARDLTPGHNDGAFLFPQMTMDAQAKFAAGEHEWSPNFVDYLFLAFNTSTAFSPTDVPVLSRWAKILMMLQSLISLVVIALLAARAVNIL
jgi:hypothetical protein